MNTKIIERSRGGFGTWITLTIVLIVGLAVTGGAAHMQNMGLSHSIVESYLGHEATQIAVSAIEEAFYKLHHNLLSPEVDRRIRNDWVAFLTSVPDGSHPTDAVAPKYTRYQFQEAADRPTDFTVEQIEDVRLSMIDASFDFAHAFQSGAVEFEAAVRLRVGSFPAGIAVTRRVRIRKRFCAAVSDAALSPDLRFLDGDISREVTRR
jgi:hypothetical protein